MGGREVLTEELRSFQRAIEGDAHEGGHRPVKQPREPESEPRPDDVPALLEVVQQAVDVERAEAEVERVERRPARPQVVGARVFVLEALVGHVLGVERGRAASLVKGLRRVQVALRVEENDARCDGALEQARCDRPGRWGRSRRSKHLPAMHALCAHARAVPWRSPPRNARHRSAARLSAGVSCAALAVGQNASYDGGDHGCGAQQLALKSESNEVDQELTLAVQV